ncbi:MAG: C1 family peptidase [Actinomycetota bacterium]|nr:C1 family peptidase [Actinomycetota bacterium]
MTAGELTTSDLERLAKELGADPHHKVLQNALTRNQVDAVALDHDVMVSAQRSMSHQLDDWAVTDQQQSGRCWLFAGLNLLRVGAARELGVKDFEFSQNHLLFWDKLEKANFWLEAVIETASREVDDRTVAHLLTDPTGDGGQWNMFVALVRKYGLVPKSAMPETVASSSTGQMNRDLTHVLRQAARDLRARAASGDDVDQLRAAKATLLSTVHRMLSLHLGTPPATVDWQWRDKDKGFHRVGVLTPQEFAQRYVTLPLDDYVSLVDDPRATSPRGRVFTVEFLGNVVDAPPVTYLNVEIDLIKRLARESIVAGEPVWFGCDVDQMYEKDNGVWDAALYDYDAVYGTTTDLHKADRLLHGATMMTHAMLLTGVDVIDRPEAAAAPEAPELPQAPEGSGEPVSRRWRVENSWGDKDADKGFHTMNDSWFAEHVFEIAVRRDALPEHLRARLADEPLVLPAWDPMGALAR